jgi:diguanylate cyclase (GGDEF)-like protein
VATILLIESSAGERAQLRALLDAAQIFATVLEAEDGLEGLRLLLSRAVDVVLCGVEVPKLDGEKLLRMKESSPGGANIPFLYLTEGGVEHRARVLERGASDAIEKPFHPPELVARLQLHLKVKRLQDELVLKNASLARLSSLDALTGLRARRFVDEMLNIEFLRARRYRTDLALVMLDVDHFKRINDEHGHVAGDAVLRGLSEMLLCVTRRTDVAGRFGGEEFLVIMPQCRAANAKVFAERLRESVEKARFPVEGSELRVTLSAGVAQYDRRFGSPEDLLCCADRALYDAKAAGRNRVAVG